AVVEEELRRVCGGGLERRHAARGHPVLAEEGVMRAVVDLECAATVTAVADDVPAVRLPRRDREQHTARQPRLLLRLQADPVEPLPTRPVERGGELGCCL